MIELPIWVFVLMCILSAPIALVVVFIILLVLCMPFFVFKCASQADDALGIGEGMPISKEQEKE